MIILEICIRFFKLCLQKAKAIDKYSKLIDKHDKVIDKLKQLLYNSTMKQDEIKRLIDNIRVVKAEDTNVELKTALGGPPKLYNTISSFSNQNSGGIIICGIDEDNDFRIDGVYSVKDLTDNIVNQCDEMEPKVVPKISSIIYDEKLLVVIEITGVDYMQRPVYRRAQGINGGSYIRSGSFDRHMSQVEIYNYQSFKQRFHDDIRVVKDVSKRMIDEKYLQEYFLKIKKEKPNLASNVPDKEILNLTGVMKNDEWTIAGVLAFSNYPQTYFPQLCITGIKVNKDYVNNNDIASDEYRFEDNIKITGNISAMIKEAIDFIEKNIRTKVLINNKGERINELEYPMDAIREALLNAIVHRDYSIHSEGIPISIVIYNDKIVIRNPGGLYGNVDISMLGNTHIGVRNTFMVDILETLQVTENRYSGIPTMYNKMKEYNLSPPIFESINGEFIVKFDNKRNQDNNRYNVKKKNNDSHKLELEIIKFCQVPRDRQEIVDFIGKSRYYVMNVLVNRLLKNGELTLTIPDKPKSPYQKYVIRKEDDTKQIKSIKQFRFSMIGLNKGDEVSFNNNQNYKFKIISDKQIEYKGKPESLSSVAKKLLYDMDGKERKSVNGPAWFFYNGRKLDEIRQFYDNK